MSQVAAGFKMQFTGPAGASMPNTSFFTPVSGALNYGLTNAMGAVSGMTGSGASQTLRVAGLLIIAGVAGTFRWQWAQNTANVSNTIVHAGTRMILTRLV
ncbi:MAG: hypothetical protein A2Y75_05465 [Candidatus Solincola sediminis]|uniref:Uncharacterized protein n=1 Tax=Candidatus Solincola sediminis TaxID=1797199 RepID=A0A1F2WGA6_9ACTN|nr:MAG: hypothetical protein A2Y75_05465 [Candidatus Solincola sediminis]